MRLVFWSSTNRILLNVLYQIQLRSCDKCGAVCTKPQRQYKSSLIYFSVGKKKKFQKLDVTRICLFASKWSIKTKKLFNRISS